MAGELIGQSLKRFEDFALLIPASIPAGLAAAVVKALSGR
jgi:hypothetical protein